jgi:GT2 family glycosyltransferase
VVIADGMSDDGTREVLVRMAESDARLRIVENPGRIVPKGLNAAIRAARGQVIVRMDAHTQYAPDYLRQCLAVLRETCADNVGGPWVTRGDGYLPRAIAAAFQSPFAAGGARAHDPDYEGPLDTVYLGCWPRSVFDRVGLFDEELFRNEDDEFNLRLTRASGRIWQSPRIRSWYTPRGSLSALFLQYFQYGYWKVRVIQKHKRPASARHLVPGLFVLGLGLGWLAGFVHWSLWVVYGGAVACYALLNILFSVRAAMGRREAEPQSRRATEPQSDREAEPEALGCSGAAGPERAKRVEWGENGRTVTEMLNAECRMLNTEGTEGRAAELQSDRAPEPQSDRGQKSEIRGQNGGRAEPQKSAGSGQRSEADRTAGIPARTVTEMLNAECRIPNAEGGTANGTAGVSARTAAEIPNAEGKTNPGSSTDIQNSTFGTQHSTFPAPGGHAPRAPGRRNWDLLPVLPIVFLTYHLAYGTGFLLGLWDFVIRRKGGREKMSRPTR